MTIKKIGILGSGTMGKQIALICAAHDITTIIWNPRLTPHLPDDVRKVAVLQTRLGTLDKGVLDSYGSKLSFTADMSSLADCDIIFDAVKEDIDVKVSVLQELAMIVGDEQVIATNTSTLSITRLASLFKRPERFVGVHFFNPVFSMKLVEVIRGEYTSEAVTAAMVDFLSLFHKHVVILPETPGFVVNRLLFPMINEAIFLLAEGIAEPKVIDSCMKFGANHPMGPLELADLIGLDVCLSILETLVSETGDDKYRPAPLLRKYVRAGKLGKKSGNGFYTYRSKKAESNS